MAPVASSCAAALVSVALAAGPSKASKVVVWPSDPQVDASAGERVVREQPGYDVSSFAPIRRQLVGQVRKQTQADDAAAAAVDRALEDARAAFLEQRFDDMAAGLEAAESAHLSALAIPARCGSLWELEFQRGLAELSRKQPDAARVHFEAALALDPQRRPVEGLYGPKVTTAFIDAVDARARKTARDVVVELSPASSRVWVDCRAVGSQVSLRPGRHAVVAVAIGHGTVARSFVQDADVPIRVELPTTWSAATGLGPAWQGGQLEPTEPGVRAALVAAIDAAAKGGTRPDEVIWVARDDAGYRVSRLAGERIVQVETGPTVESAVRKLLARKTRPVPQPSPPPKKKKKRVGLWVGLGVGGAVLVGAVIGVVFALRNRDDRLEVVVR